MKHVLAFLALVLAFAGPCGSCGLFGDTAQQVPVTAEYTLADEPEFSFDGGEIREVPAGYLISGDVEVEDEDGNWLALYDGKPDGSGLIVVVHGNARIKAPWGAWASQNTKLDDLKAEMLTNGCGREDGCETVIVIHWPAEPTPEPED